MKTFIPSCEIESFKKFIAKTQRNVKDLKVTIGEPYEKIFVHTVKLDGGRLKSVKEFHKVHDVEIDMPEDSGWRLLATIEGKLMFVANPTEKLVFKNPKHGIDYEKCDVCGHSAKAKSYIVYNEKDGVELQVGSECAKKFGLKNINYLAKFVRELYRSYDFALAYGEEEDGFPRWPSWISDKWKYAAIESSVLIGAARKYYADHKVWIKGYYDNNRRYVSSQSQAEIQELASKEEEIEKDEEYTENVKAYCNKMLKEKAKRNGGWLSEFEEGMLEFSGNYYVSLSRAAHAYFMIKMYEEYLEAKNNSIDIINVGQQVKVSGEVKQIEEVEGYFGTFEVYTIETNKGYIVTRAGKIPIEEDGDVKKTNFFAIVEKSKMKDISVGRALKHPKKGIEIIEL